MTPLSTRVALVLAGGNALGAYGAGAYEALHERGYLPDVVSGASIGAANGAIVAGNLPERRIEKLREFWAQAGVGSAPGWAPASGKLREMYNVAHAMQTALFGRPGLFVPRLPGLLSALPGMPRDVAMFDQRPATATLQRVIDFELLNRATVPLIVNAVDMQSGEPVRFDTRRQAIGPEHLIASAALAPVFTPIRMGEQELGDPGLISNLPIDAVLEPPVKEDLICFAVDLFTPNDEPTRSLYKVIERAQDILFAAQAKRALDARAREHRLRYMIGSIAAGLPAEAQGDDALRTITAQGTRAELTLVSLAYRAPAHELAMKTLEFSRASITERWVRGREDMLRALDRLEAGQSTERADGCTIYDARGA